MEDRNKIKVENFKIGKSSASEINSGLLILIFGISILTLPLLSFTNNFNVESNINTYPSILGQISDNLFIIVFTVGTNSFDFILSGIIGWGLGGLIAALLYGNEGKNGPLYASYLLLRLISGIIILFLPIIPIFIVDFLEFVPIVIIPLVILVFSLPLILVAMISYRIGLWISPSD